MDKEKYRDLIEEFKKIGRIMFAAGLCNSHNGNMSVRVGNRILITRRGSMLGFLQDLDIIETGLDRNDCGIALTSTEVNVHRAILKGTSSLAVVHTHLLTATALSYICNEIIPIDVEGSYYLRKIPVIEFEFGTSSKEMEQELPRILKNYKIVMIKGHGAFSIGDYLEEALHYAHMLECISRIIYMTKIIGGDLATLQKPLYSSW